MKSSIFKNATKKFKQWEEVLSVISNIDKGQHKYLVYKTIQGRNLPNLFGGTFENEWFQFHRYILTSEV